MLNRSRLYRLLQEFWIRLASPAIVVVSSIMDKASTVSRAPDPLWKQALHTMIKTELWENPSYCGYFREQIAVNLVVIFQVYDRRIAPRIIN